MRPLLVLALMIMGPVMYGQNMAKTTRVLNDEGKLQMLIAYSPSCSCRSYTEFYPDGKVYAKRIYRVVDKGEYIDGDDISYYHDGTIKQYKLWKNAVPEGRAYANYENGKLEHEEFYQDKFKSGIWKYYDKSGALVREQIYQSGKDPWNNKKENVTIRYYAAGKLQYTNVYAGGKVVKSDRKDDVKMAVPNDPEMVDGKKLFAMKCAACHAPDKDGYGPALRGVTQKRSKLWLTAMIRNGMKLVEEGDKDAVALYNQWGKKKHFNMEYLTGKQVQAIIDYLKTMK